MLSIGMVSQLCYYYNGNPYTIDSWYITVEHNTVLNTITGRQLKHCSGYELTENMPYSALTDNWLWGKCCELFGEKLPWDIKCVVIVKNNSILQQPSVNLFDDLLCFSTFFLMGPVKQIKRMFAETRLIATIVVLVSGDEGKTLKCSWSSGWMHWPCSLYFMLP